MIAPTITLQAGSGGYGVSGEINVFENWDDVTMGSPSDERIIEDFKQIRPCSRRYRMTKDLKRSVIDRYRFKERQRAALIVKRRRRLEKIADIHCFSDGGRNLEFPNESNDCAVRAMAVATGIEYSKAHALFAELGRANGKGTPRSSTWIAVGRTVLHKKQIAHRGTVEKFVRAHPIGRFLVFSSRHVAAVVNGKLYDGDDTTLNRVREVWALCMEGEPCNELCWTKQEETNR